MGATLFCASVSEAVRDELKEHGADFRDADGADYWLAAAGDARPETVAALWQKRDAADLIVACRRARRGIRNRLYRRWLDLPYYDYTSGLRLYRASALTRVGGDVTRPLEAMVRLHRDGFKIREVTVDDRPNGHGARWAELSRLRRLRNAPDAADADDRAYQHGGRRMTERQEHIVSFLEVDVPLLDVGCGSGRLIQSVAKGIGLDIDVRKLRYLRGRAPAAVAGSIARLPFRDEAFPQLVCADVLQRLPASDTRWSELRRVLRPGGTLVVETPDAAHWKSRLSGGAVPNPYTEPKLRQELENHGFAIDEIRRVGGADMIVRAVRR